MIGPYFSFNGSLLPVEQAVLPIDDIELTYGFGVYETFRLRHGDVSLVVEHVDRLFHSATCISLEHLFSKEEIQSWLQNLVQANGTDAATVKMLLLGGKTKEAARLYIFFLGPKFLEKKEYREGVRVITFEHERLLPQAKTLNMLPSYIAYTRAQRDGAYEALFVDREGNIREGTRSNFFAIKDTTLYTPPKELVLDGITRRTVIECAREPGWATKETQLPLAEIFTFDGAFLTNTSHKIIPVKTIGNKSFKQIVENIILLRQWYDATS